MIPTVATAISIPKMTAMVPTMMAKTKMSGKQSVRPHKLESYVADNVEKVHIQYNIVPKSVS